MASSVAAGDSPGVRCGAVCRGVVGGESEGGVERVVGDITAEGILSRSDEWQVSYFRALASVLESVGGRGEELVDGGDMSRVLQGFIRMSSVVLGVGGESLQGRGGGEYVRDVLRSGGRSGASVGASEGVHESGGRLHVGDRVHEPVDVCVGDDESRIGLSSVSASRKAKRERYKNNKRSRQSSSSDGVAGSVKSSGEHAECGTDVPEWRRKSNIGPARYVSGLINEVENPDLLQSVKEKWIAKNKLQKAKDERELKLLLATDVEAEISKRNAAARASYERSLVSIEKSHSRLIASDCVPDDELTDEQRLQRGVVHTVLSSSVSPGSSASMAEFREMQKKVLDLEKKNEDMEKRHGLITKACDKLGISLGNIYHNSKSLWTCDEMGDLTSENCDLLCDGEIGYTIADLPVKGSDGKFRVPVNVF